MKLLRLLLWAVLAVLLTAGPGKAAYPIFSAGTGISITIAAGAASRVIANTGVTSLAGTANQTSASASTGAVTISLIGPYTPATYTAHGIIIGEGTSSLVATSVMTNGQVLVGSTGADPAPATLGCTGCTWSTGAGTLSLTISAGAVSSVTGTANQILASPTTGAVVLSLIGPYTPATYTAHGILLGEGTSSIVPTAVMTNGQVLVGSTGADPVPATLGAGTGISYATGAGTLTINNTGVTSVAGTANQTAVSGSTGAVTISLIGPYSPTTYTAHGITVGEGTAAMVAIPVATNGQVIVGSTGADPVPATLGCTGCSWTTGAGTLSLTATGTSGGMTTTQVASGSCPYTVLTTDVLLLVSSGAVADCVLTFPAATGSNRVIAVKKQDAGAKNVKPTPNGTDTFDGVNSAESISIQYEEKAYVDYAANKWADL